MLDDFHQNYDLRRNLLQNEYDSIGIACSCHPTLQQFCIIELGLNVQAVQPDHEHPAISFLEELQENMESQAEAAKIQKSKVELQKSQRSLDDEENDYEDYWTHLKDVEPLQIIKKNWRYILDEAEDYLYFEEWYADWNRVALHEFKQGPDPTCSRTPTY